MKSNHLIIALLCLTVVSQAVDLDEWAVEFEGSRANQEKRASDFTAHFGIINGGRILDLNVFLLKMPSGAKRSSLQQSAIAILDTLEETNQNVFPSHPDPAVDATQNAYAKIRDDGAKRDSLHVGEGGNSYGIRWVQRQVAKQRFPRTLISTTSPSRTTLPPKNWKKFEFGLPFATGSSSSSSFSSRSTASRPLEMKHSSKRATPTDPLYDWQFWNHPVSDYVSINAAAAWDAGFDGTGVTIAIVDDGVQHSHPDLSPNYVAQSSYDFNRNQNDPSPDLTKDFHGTACAGMAAASADGASCGVGAAPRANISGIRLISEAFTDATGANALSFQPQSNDIYSNSWGPSDDGATVAGFGPLELQSVRNSINSGRGGRGNIYTWATGNGYDLDNCIWDEYASNRYVIGVGSINHDGTHADYSEYCPSVLVVAPSDGDSNTFGLVTTDLMGSSGYNASDCTISFGGTSGATPQVAGVVALMLDANSNLSWLDVQKILIQSATKNDPDNPYWTTNGAGYNYHYQYGFGLVDAAAAVTRAQALTTAPEMTSEVYVEYSITQNLTWTDLPDGSLGSIQKIHISESFVVHHAQVILPDAINCTSRHWLWINLTSPDGTISQFGEPQDWDYSRYADGVIQPMMKPTTFTSKAVWGEDIQGDWEFVVSDQGFREKTWFNLTRLEMGNSDPPYQQVPGVRNPGTTGPIILRFWGVPAGSITANVVKSYSTAEQTFVPDAAPAPSLTPNPTTGNSPSSDSGSPIGEPVGASSVTTQSVAFTVACLVFQWMLYF